MTRAEYERHKQRLDEELRAGMEMLAAAHRYQIRALEMVWAAMGEEGAAIPPSVGAPVAPSGEGQGFLRLAGAIDGPEDLSRRKGFSHSPPNSQIDLDGV